jgi:hypothetical protein
MRRGLFIAMNTRALPAVCSAARCASIGVGRTAAAAEHAQSGALNELDRAPLRADGARPRGRRR